MDLKGLLTVFCTVTTIGLFLTGSKVCQKILRQGNTQNVSIMPFLCTFINCILWLKYGILKPDGLLMLVNATGAGLSGVYLIIFYIHAPDKDKEHRTLLYSAFLLFSVLVYVKFYLDDVESSLATLGPVGMCALVLMFTSPLATVVSDSQQARMQDLFGEDRVHKSLLYGGLVLYSVLVYVKFFHEDGQQGMASLGQIGICSTVCMFGSPLATVAQVCRTKSTESLPFAMSLATFITALEWLMYGRLVSDFYIEFPNFLGMVLGLIQLLLFVWYPSTPSHVKGSTGPTSTV